MQDQSGVVSTAQVLRMEPQLRTLLRGTDGWRIDRFRFNLKFIDGNARLEEAE